MNKHHSITSGDILLYFTISVIIKMDAIRDKLFTEYLRHNEINMYLDDLNNRYSNRVNVKIIGHSYEGREIKCITITDNIQNHTKNKNIFIDGGAHAREWITISMTLYIIYELVEKFHNNSNLLSNFNWVVLPVVNPDGYEFSHEKVNKINRN